MKPATAVLSMLAEADATYQASRRGEWVVDENLDPADARMYDLALAMMGGAFTADSSLLWISSAMVDLIEHAAKTLPPYDFDTSVLPWRESFVVLDRPLSFSGDGPAVEAIQWAVPGNDGVWLSLLGRPSPDPALRPFCVTSMTPGAAWSDVDRVGADPEVIEQTSKIVCALWLLVQQKVAVSRRVGGDRADRRRWGREHDEPIPDVIVVELRRPLQTTPHEDSPGVQVDWSHRWIVDGHWRNQAPDPELSHPDVDRTARQRTGGQTVGRQAQDRSVGPMSFSATPKPQLRFHVQFPVKWRGWRKPKPQTLQFVNNFSTGDAAVRAMAVFADAAFTATVEGAGSDFTRHEGGAIGPDPEDVRALQVANRGQALKSRIGELLEAIREPGTRVAAVDELDALLGEQGNGTDQ